MAISAIETILLVISVLLILAVIASKASVRLGIPALLLFLVIGMLAGSEGLGGIYFDDPWTAQLMGSIALSYILFSGGLDTRWKTVKKYYRPAVLLSTIGVALTAVLLGLFAHWVFKMNILEGILLGAIVSSTDAAAVFSILRSRSVRLKAHLEAILELESGSNDPMAVFLTLGLTSLLLNPAQSPWSLIIFFFVQMIVGALIGYITGKGTVWLVNRLNLKIEGLYTVFIISSVLFIYGFTTTLQGNGFLAVYIAGVMMGNASFIHKRPILKFFDGLAWLMQIIMFLTLGLLVFPSQLIPVVGIGLLVAVFLILVARPVSVFISLAFIPLKINEKMMLSWVGLRGAVPIILATFPLMAGLPDSNLVFNIVFFVVLLSSLVQGSSIPFVARILKVDQFLPPKQDPVDEFATKIEGKLKQVEVQCDSIACGKTIMELNLPEEILFVLIERDDIYIIPRGDTVIKENDRIDVLFQPDLEKTVDRVFLGSAAAE